LVFTGSDLTVLLAEEIPIPPQLQGRATELSEIQTAYLKSDQTPVDVIGVDRQTFADAAFWDSSFSDRSLPDLLAALAPPPGTTAPVPTIVAGGAIATDGASLIFRQGHTELPLHVVATTKAFPGLQPGRPLLVVDRSVLADRDIPSFPALWVKGPNPDQALKL